MASEPLKTGDRLGRYQIEDFLAAGGMGVLYRARDLSFPRQVAIKVLPSGFMDSESVERFMSEGKALMMLQHPHVVVTHDVVLDPVPHIIMELLKAGETGGDLSKVMAR